MQQYSNVTVKQNHENEETTAIGNNLDESVV